MSYTMTNRQSELDRTFRIGTIVLVVEAVIALLIILISLIL